MAKCNTWDSRKGKRYPKWLLKREYVHLSLSERDLITTLLPLSHRSHTAGPKLGKKLAITHKRLGSIYETETKYLQIFINLGILSHCGLIPTISFL